MAESMSQVVKELMDQLRDKNTDDERRFQTSELLAFCGEAAIRPLIEALGDPDPETRHYAVMAFECGANSNATPAVPALRRCMNDPDERVRESAAIALRLIEEDGDPAFRDRLRQLATRDLRVIKQDVKGGMPLGRMMAAHLIGTIGRVLGATWVAPAIPDLIEAIWDEKPAVRNSAIEAIGHIGPTAIAAEFALRARLTMGETTERYRARIALIHIGAPCSESAS